MVHTKQKSLNSTITCSTDYTIGSATNGEFWTWEYPNGIPFTTLEGSTGGDKHITG